MRVLLVAVVLLSCVGCFTGPLRVGQLNPRPNVVQVGALDPRPNVAPQVAGAPAGGDKAVAASFAPAHPALSLSLDAEIPDQFVVRRRNRIPDTNVQSWRASLTSGFRNAFGPEQPGGRAIVIDRAELSWAPAAVDNHGSILAMNAQLTYRASLVDGAGRNVGGVAGTVESKSPASNFDGIEPSVTSAIESMYEDISVRLLGESGKAPRTASGASVATPDR